MIRLRLVDFGAFEVIRSNAERPQGLLESIGAFYTGIASRNYTDRMHGAGTGGTDWEPRMVPNVPGIINDLREVSTPKDRRFEGWPVPFDTGLLSRSTHAEVEKDRVVVGIHGPAQEYADAQHFGGPHEMDEPITENVVRRLNKWLQSSAGQPWKNDLGWLAREEMVGKTLTINIRPRPWLNFSEQDHEDLRELLPEGMLVEGGRFIE